MTVPTLPRANSLAGCLLGTAIGDALGLPYEGLTARRAERLYGPPDRYRFLFGRGMVSDDTEHACLVAQSLIATAGEPQAFAADLAMRLRWWLAGLPAGTGRATLRACARLWFGVSPDRSGVFSAGNGPAMRATLLGAAIEDVDRLRPLVRASTRLTHTDPQAEAGAWIIALAAGTARRETRPDGQCFLDTVAESFARMPELRSEFLLDRLSGAVESIRQGESTDEFVTGLGLRRGVTGFVGDTVPAVVHAWLRHPTDFRRAVTEVIRCGGDADTTAALVGGLVGTTVGTQGLPREWLDGLAERPRSVRWMTQLAERLDAALAEGVPTRPPSLPAIPLLARNAVFLATVLTHGFYRLRPW